VAPRAAPDEALPNGDSKMASTLELPKIPLIGAVWASQSHKNVAPRSSGSSARPPATFAPRLRAAPPRGGRAAAGHAGGGGGGDRGPEARRGGRPAAGGACAPGAAGRSSRSLAAGDRAEPGRPMAGDWARQGGRPAAGRGRPVGAGCCCGHRGSPAPLTMAELATGGHERAGGGVTREEGETRMGEAAEWIRE